MLNDFSTISDMVAKAASSNPRDVDSELKEFILSIFGQRSPLQETGEFKDLEAGYLKVFPALHTAFLHFRSGTSHATLSPGCVDLIKFMQGDKDTVEKAVTRFKTLNGAEYDKTEV